MHFNELVDLIDTLNTDLQNERDSHLHTLTHKDLEILNKFNITLEEYEIFFKNGMDDGTEKKIDQFFESLLKLEKKINSQSFKAWLTPYLNSSMSMLPFEERIAAARQSLQRKTQATAVTIMNLGGLFPTVSENDTEVSASTSSAVDTSPPNAPRKLR